MNILVTGGAGFIGSHIVDSLIKLGHCVSIADNLSTGNMNNVNEQAHFHNVDICRADLHKVFRNEKPDIVMHYAANTMVSKSMEKPAWDARQNILGSINLITICARFKVKRIVYASSAAIYGNPAYIPVDEVHPINPVSNYGLSKYVVEKYLDLYCREYGLPYTALRYSNVFGPRQNSKCEAGVVAIFADHMFHNERPVIFGDGNKTRDYIYIDDVVAANRKVIENNIDGVYNISTATETADQSIFDMLADLLHFKGRPEYVPVRKGEIIKICLSNAKAQEALKWKNGSKLADALSGTAAYYQKLFTG
jgi:UDP-glucose 4-epimerase